MSVLANDNLKDFLKEIKLPVLVDFYGDWCSPCKMIAPIIDDLIKEYDGKVEIIKVNVDENPVSTGDFGIRSIPTLLVFDKKGELVRKQSGAIPKSKIVEMFESYL